MCLLLTTALGFQGYEVVGEAYDGDSAVLMARELRPELIVLDARMPKLDGIEALPRLRMASPGAKVVVFSADPPGRMEATALAAGADAYVDKIEGVFGVLAAFERISGPGSSE